MTSVTSSSPVATTDDGYVITEMHPDSNALYGSGIFASVKTPDGATFLLSQLEGESHWVADGLFGANGMPHWCHGFGSRCTLLRTVDHAGLVAALDQAAAKFRACEECGADPGESCRVDCTGASAARGELS